MKRIIRILICGFLTLLVAGGSSFGEDEGAVPYENLRIVVDGAEQPVPVGQAYMVPDGGDGTLYMSARAIAACFHKEVRWDGKNLVFKDSPNIAQSVSCQGIKNPSDLKWNKMKSVGAVFKSDTLIFNPTAESNESSHLYLEVNPAFNVEGRIYLPIKPISALFGKNFHFDQTAKMIEIGWRPYASEEIAVNWNILKLGDWLQLQYPSEAVLLEDNRIIRFKDGDQEWSEIVIDDVPTRYNWELSWLKGTPDGDCSAYAEMKYKGFVPLYDYNDNAGWVRMTNDFGGRNYSYSDPQNPQGTVRLEILSRTGHSRAVFASFKGTPASFANHYETFHQIVDTIRMD